MFWHKAFPLKTDRWERVGNERGACVIKWQESVKSFLPLHQQTGVSLRFPTSRVLSTGAPWPRGAACNLRQLPQKKKKEIIIIHAQAKPKLTTDDAYFFLPQTCAIIQLGWVICLIDARSAASESVNWRHGNWSARYETAHPAPMKLSLLTVLKNWISSSPSPPSAMAVKEPAQTLEATADCRQKRDAVPLKPILA